MTHRWKKLNNGKPFPHNYRKENLYDYHEVNELIERLVSFGYECRQTDEGCLGEGNWICVPPDDKYYNYLINEVPVNEWSSAHTIRRCSRLSKANQRLFEEAG